MTVTDLSEYRAAAELDKDSWLGVMVIWSVEDSKVKWADLSRTMTDGGLAAYIPPEPSDENVWRRIWSDGVRKTIPSPTDDEPNAEQRIMMRQLSRENGVYTKRVVIEHVSPAGKKLGYEEVIEVTFDKANPTHVGIRTVGAWHDEAWALVNRLREEYDRQRGCLDGQGIRVVIRAILESCRATTLRPGGGCYFVHQAYEMKVEALERVADIIPGTLVHTLPIVDTVKQRQNLKKAFEFESANEMETLIAEMRDLVGAGGEITPQKSASFNKAAQKAKAKLAEYQGLLNDNLDVVDAKVQIFDTLYLQLLSQVKA